MSKSPVCVTAALSALGLPGVPVEMPGGTRTAEEDAAAIGCHIDQIAKSILFAAGEGCALFLTAGGNRVDGARASDLAGRALGRADAATVRRVTGFAIGGVAPLGRASTVPTWLDPRLLDFAEIWAAAGTPRHVFPVAPGALRDAAGAIVAEFTA